MAQAAAAGRFVWHELMTTDTSAAERFYAGVAGWGAAPSSEHPGYTMFTVGEHPVAGLMALREEAVAGGAPPGWLVYVGSSDVDDTVRRAEALGGSVVRAAADIPNVGRFAVLRDPQGAVFGVMTQPDAPVPSGVPGVGEFSWHELATTDWEAAVSFYEQLFGWLRTGSTDMGPAGPYQMFGFDKHGVGGIFNKPAEMPGPPAWLPYIKVADATLVAAHVPSLGGTVVNGPMEVPGGDWITRGLDPQHAMFAVHSVKRVPESAPAQAPEAAGPPQMAATTGTRARRRSTPAKAVSKATARRRTRKSAKASRKATSGAKVAAPRKATVRSKAAASRKATSARTATGARTRAGTQKKTATRKVAGVRQTTRKGAKSSTRVAKTTTRPKTSRRSSARQKSRGVAKRGQRKR